MQEMEVSSVVATGQLYGQGLPSMPFSPYEMCEPSYYPDPYYPLFVNCPY